MRKQISIFTTVMFLMIRLSSLSQTNSSDTIYQSPEKSAVYQSDSKSLIKYVQNELLPIISACNTNEDELITRLKLIFIIDIYGNVIDVNFNLENLTGSCQELIQKKILQMPQWTPATMNGKPVCSEFNFPISCIKYD